MRKKFEGIRKVKWDAMWHILYKDSKGEITWDRVSIEEALSLLKEVQYGITERVQDEQV